MALTAIILALIATTAANQMDIRPINRATPIVLTKLADAHTSYEVYKTVYFINLTEYENAPKRIERAIIDIKQLCQKLTLKEICTPSLEQLKQRLEKIESENEKLHARRAKRGVCNLCGTVQRFLYGTMDAETAHQWANQINGLGNETERQHNILVNQTRITEIFMKTSAQSLKNMKIAIQSFDDNFNRVIATEELQQAEMDRRTRALALIQATDLAITGYEATKAEIERALDEDRAHKIPNIIPMKVLAEHVEDTIKALKENQKLPIVYDPKKPHAIYQYAETRSALMNNMLMTEVTIPAAEAEAYTLYKATPIPVDTSAGRIIAMGVDRYFLLSRKQTKYIALTQNEITNSKMITPSDRLYSPTAIIQLRYENVCAWRLMLTATIEGAHEICNFAPMAGNDIVLPIIDHESYFTSFNKITVMRELCEDEPPKQREVVGRNIITMDPNCDIKTTSFKIKTHKTHAFNHSQIIEPIMTNDTLEELTRLADVKTTKIQVANKKPLLIQDEAELKHLISESADLAAAAKHEFKWQSLKDDADTWNISLGSGGAILAMILIGGGVTAYCKFGTLSTGMGIIRQVLNGPNAPSAPTPEPVHMEQLNDRIEHGEKQYPKTPHLPARHSKKKRHGNDDNIV